MKPMRVWLLACFAVSVAGCGMLSGLDGLTVTDGGNVDASDDGVLLDVSIDIGPACEAGACGAPAGFQPILFANDRNTVCPSGLSSIDVVVDPSPAANSCTCVCNYQPSCSTETLTYSTGINACTQLSTTQTVLDGGCNKGSGMTPPSRMSFGPFAPTNPCTSTLGSAGTVTSTSGRLCSVESCAACIAPVGFSLCFAQPGLVACPKGMTTHVTGENAVIECGACGACTSTATCKGTLTIYDDGACALKDDTYTVDGTCNSTFDVDTLGSYKYAPSVDPGMCVPGTSVANVSVSAQTTVCCP
jgi:hypothetical protein